MLRLRPFRVNDSRRTAGVCLLASLALLGAAGCGGGQPTEIGAAQQSPPPTKAAKVGVPPIGEDINDKGDPIRLDETASLACANAEFARDDLRNGNIDSAIANLKAAADRARPSAVGELAGRADAIRTAVESGKALAVVEAFIAECVARGHLL
jgi:hypothetical protein